MQWIGRHGGVDGLLGARFSKRQLGLAWLGQAGFAIRYGSRRLLVDPYLSDHLARKYQGTHFPHVRMMRPPIGPDNVRDLDLVLCSHAHSDHMDPDALPMLARNNRRCRFVVPSAEIEKARERGLPDDRMIPVNADQTVPFFEDIELIVTPAAHEQFDVNQQGDHRFLGFILRCGETAIYHAGDTVPFDGLTDRLRKHRVDVALLPINGRDAYRTSHGVPGNMTFDEAVDLCVGAGVGLMIAHHFGMFEFNTPNMDCVASKIRRLPATIECVVPQPEKWYELRPGSFRQAGAGQ